MVMTCRPHSNKCTRTQLFLRRDLDVRENILTANAREKIFTIIYRVPKRKCSSCALRKGLLLRNMNNLHSAYSSLIRHATQQTARHDTPNKNIVSKYEVSVLYLSQYFNHSAIYVKKNIKVLGN